MLIFVTAHELFHILTAMLIFKFEKKEFALKEVIFTPLGEIAQIEGMEKISGKGRAAIYVSGPLLNLFIALLCKNRQSLVYFGNMGLFIVNLLPAFPFDGGRILQIILGNAVGAMLGNGVINRLTKFTAYLLIVAGLFQLALFPYNFSILCLGVYMRLNGDIQAAANAADFYRYEVTERVKFKKGLTKKRIIYAKSETKAFKIFNRLTFDYLHEINITDKGITISETEFTDAADKIGFNSCMEPVIEFVRSFREKA